MRVASLLAVIFISVSWPSSAQSAELDGRWIAYEPIPSVSPDEKDTRWFYENRLTISVGSIRLEKLPVWRRVKQKRWTYSASDGAFPVFVGRLEGRGGAQVARLEIQSCDYCGEVRDGAAEGHKAWYIRHGIERQGKPKDYPVVVSGQTLTVDQVSFHRVSKFPHE